MGDGDLGAVVWGVVSASSSSVSGLHSQHTPSMLGASSSSSWDSSVEFGFSQAYDHFQSPARMELPASGGTTLTQGINPDLSAKTGETPPKGSPPAPKKSTDCKQLSRRRKLQQKRTVYVPVGGDGRPSGEILPSDMWAWRKYGQKPIKGSPYPRGYYKCSSSKGCSARKQVERSPTDPSMLIITYTSEHNHSWPAHRNSLAGTIRPKSSLQKSVATFCSDLAASDPPHKLSGSISNANASPSGTNLSSGNTAFLPGDSGNLETVSRFSSQDEEFFLEFDHLPVFSSALRKTCLDDEGGNAEVDPYNLFCWSAGGLPTF